MSFILSCIILFISSSVFADSQIQDIEKRVFQIKADIKKIEEFLSSGSRSKILEDRKNNLQKEYENYLKLIKDLKKKNKKLGQLEKASSPTIKDKNIPDALSRVIRDYKKFEDESIPLEKRYELILTEINNLYELNSKIDSLPENELTQTLIELKRDNNLQLKELRLIKSKQELLLIKSEQTELEEMKKIGVRVGVMFDAYYQWDFDKPKRTGNNGNEILYRNYNNRHNDFTVNLLEINLYKSFKEIDFYADIDFGEQPEQNKSVSSDAITHHIGQAFLRYRPKEFNNVTFTGGKFYSHFGLEVPKNIDNKTYSRPFYFTLVCPFWHEGVSLTQSGIMDHFGYGLYVYDKTDDRVDNDSDKTYGAQLNFSKNKISAIYNLITGSEHNNQGAQANLNQNGNKKTMHEAIISYQATDEFTLTFDGIMGMSPEYDSATQEDILYQSMVFYADLRTAPKNFINLRYENFNDLTSKKAQNNLFTTTSNFSVKPPQLDSYTLTNRYLVGNGSEVRLELRVDTSTTPIFPESKGGFKKTQETMTLGWLYSI
ncbi:MAG: outer membrane beta-barrel protein [Bacteriovoracaceae bacterium]